MNKRFISVQEFCEQTNVGRTKAYQLIAAGEIVVRKLGRRTLVDVESVSDWASKLPQMKARAGT
ncbi:helix-turn-helix domain-containing protein [Azospirillum argentinense]